MVKSNELIFLYFQTEVLFDSMKAHLKRAPSLRGAALVRLSSLKIQAKPWPKLFNNSEALSKLDEVSKLFKQLN